MKRITLIKHIINQGQSLLQTGKFWKLNKADLFVTFDSDGQHSATEAAAMIKNKFYECRYNLGSRFKEKKLQLEILSLEE